MEMWFIVQMVVTHGDVMIPVDVVKHGDEVFPVDVVTHGDVLAH